MRQISILLVALCLSLGATAKAKRAVPQESDRQYWAALCYRMAAPVLEPMASGRLQATMSVEYSPTWDGRDKQVAWLECFGRLMAGVAPWLSLPDDESSEGQQRRQLREWALKSYANAVDPDSPDHLTWDTEPQALVDAAYLANSFLRGWHALWEPLPAEVKARYIAHFKSLRTVRPPYNNWVLFRAMVEAFLIQAGEPADGAALDLALHKTSEWYQGDGWYSDGPELAIDYYDSYVIHPMLVEVLEVMQAHHIWAPIPLDLAMRRMQRYNVLLERLISPEGSYPAMGRSITYRTGAFQTLALAAWRDRLPQQITRGSLRSALTAVMRRLYALPGIFSESGYLQLGFSGHQPAIADYYTNTGSLYMASLVFLPLGLPADHPFWTDPAEPWTARKAWSGADFAKDYHESVRK